MTLLRHFRFVFLACFMFAFAQLFAQTELSTPSSPRLTFSTSLLRWAYLNPNIGLRIGTKKTLADFNLAFQIPIVEDVRSTYVESFFTKLASWGGTAYGGIAFKRDREGSPLQFLSIQLGVSYYDTGDMYFGEGSGTGGATCERAQRRRLTAGPRVIYTLSQKVGKRTALAFYTGIGARYGGEWVNLTSRGQVWANCYGFTSSNLAFGEWKLDTKGIVPTLHLGLSLEWW